MNVPTRKLAELAAPAGARAGLSIGLPVYSVTKHRGFVPSLEYFKKQVFSRELDSYQIVNEGDFAYATIHLDEGSIGIAPERCLISPMYTSFRITSQDILGSYLIRYLKSNRAMANYPLLGQGSAERRRSISFGRLGEISVPVPPIEEQRRISEILDRADALRAKRREALAHLDALTQSIFLDMFGDLVSNQRSWPSGSVSDLVANFTSGKNLVAEDSADPYAIFRVLKVSAVTSLKFRPEESKALPRNYIPPAQHLVQIGDLLFSRANTNELIGATAFVERTPSNVALPDKLWRFVWHPDKRTSPRFVCQLFRQQTFREEVRRRASGTSGSMKNVSQPNVLSIPLGLPPIRAQQRFGELFRSVSELERRGVEGTEALDALFVSLQQRAFAGAL